MTDEMYAIEITPAGNIFPAKIDPETDLRDLQKIVDGYIETVPAAFKGFILIVNEEGKLNNLPVNIAASKLLSRELYDVLCGNVILCMVEGEEFVYFTEAEANKLCAGLDLIEKAFDD